MVFAVLGAVVGYMLPGLWWGRRVNARKRQIRNGLPDALDLLLLTIEAGSGLDQAFVKVANELQYSHPILAKEFRQVVTDMRAGRPRSDALRQFADRTKVEDVRSLVTMLIQTDKFGTSVGQALRTHAATARVKRRQRAEERAQKLGVKLVFPLVFCLFPALYVVILGPAILRIIHVLPTLRK
jgi:tight adherence protein C